MIAWLKSYLLARLSEASTWRGIIGVVAGMLGYDVAPEVQAQIAVVAVALMGLVGILTPDSVRRSEPQEAATEAAPFRPGPAETTQEVGPRGTAPGHHSVAAVLAGQPVDRGMQPPPVLPSHPQSASTETAGQRAERQLERLTGG